jgi:hypothetical protein
VREYECRSRPTRRRGSACCKTAHECLLSSGKHSCRDRARGDCDLTAVPDETSCPSCDLLVAASPLSQPSDEMTASDITGPEAAVSRDLSEARIAAGLERSGQRRRRHRGVPQLLRSRCRRRERMRPASRENRVRHFDRLQTEGAVDRRRDVPAQREPLEVAQLRFLCRYPHTSTHIQITRGSAVIARTACVSGRSA